MDGNTFLKRFIRYGGHARLASKLTSSHFKKNDEAFYETLALELGRFKGPLMKVGQLLAMVPDLIPETHQNLLKQLHAEAPSMGPLFVKRRMRNELGEAWQNHFDRFDLHPSAAASIGQVHKAKTLSKEDVACKLQYPNMESILTSDLTQLKLILSLYRKKGGALKTDDFYIETSEHLHEEIDYYNEAHNLSMAAAIFKDTPGIHVPVVHKNLSTRRLLTMSWLSGDTLDEVKNKSEKDRVSLSENLFWAWYYPLYGFGFLHGDPHAGNFLFSKENNIHLMDFGCVRHFPKSFLEGTCLLYQTLKKKNHDTRAAYELWGFKNLTPDLVNTLNAWSTFLYGPLLTPKAHVIGDTYNSKVGKALAQDVMKELKKSGPVDLPRPFILMHRAAIGMGAAFIQLNAPVFWQDLFENVLAQASLVRH